MGTTTGRDKDSRLSSKKAIALFDRIARPSARSRLLDVLSLGRRTNRSDEERYADLRLILETAMPKFETRDELYRHIIKAIAHSKGGEQMHWAWTTMAVCCRYMPPTKDFLELRLLPFLSEARGGHEKHRAFAKRHAEMASRQAPHYVLPRADEIAWTASEEGGLSRPPMFGVEVASILAVPELCVTVSDGVPLPRILVELCEAIIAMDGCNTEGLFRIPADIRAVEDARFAFEQEQWAYFQRANVVKDANVPAGLLKQWLRSLKEPLVPNDLYPAILDLTCGDEGNGKDSKSTRHKSFAIFKQMPRPNQAVLRCIVCLLQTIGSAENQNGTRMSVPALAMVFAPNLMRGESLLFPAATASGAGVDGGSRAGSERTDSGEQVMRVMANARAEQAFLRDLVYHLSS